MIKALNLMNGFFFKKVFFLKIFRFFCSLMNPQPSISMMSWWTLLWIRNHGVNFFFKILGSIKMQLMTNISNLFLALLWILKNSSVIWAKYSIMDQGRICGRQPLKNLKWHVIWSDPDEGWLPQILLGSFLNTLRHMTC